MGVEAFVMGGRAISVPAFFPSVTSVKANLRPSDYVRLLVSVGEPRFLVSAYDVAAADETERACMRDALALATARGRSVLLDSGNYERFWHRDANWTIERYAAVVASSVTPLAFSYDNLDPPADPQRAADEIVAAVERDQASAPTTTICPIVHGKDPDAVTRSVRSVAERLQPVLLAVAERELGDGLIARASTIRRLRSALDSTSPCTVLHILGTGSPIALAAYAIAGGQSFDGLEWCQTCVDPDTAHLHHFQHRGLVRAVEPAVTAELPYVAGTLAHNALFFRAWMTRIREALAAGSAPGLLDSVLPSARRDEVLASLCAT